MSVSATSTEGLLASETIPAQELTCNYICNPTPAPCDHFVFTAGKCEGWRGGVGLWLSGTVLAQPTHNLKLDSQHGISQA